MRFELPWAINNDLAGRMWPPGLEFDLCHKCSYQFVCLRLRYYQFNKLQNASLLQNRFARKVIGAVILVSNLRWAVKSDWTWDFTAILVLRKCLNALNMFEFNVFFSLPVELISLLRIYLQIHLSRLSPHCLGWLFAVFHAVLLPLMPQLSQSLCTAAVSSPVVESNLLHIPGNSVGPIFGDSSP